MKNNTLFWRDLVLMRDGIPLTPPMQMTLGAGELLLVQGANGAGKSTLLKTLAGLHPLTQGEIFWNDEPLADADIRPIYIGHRRGLQPMLSVRDNVKVWADASDVPELYAAALHYFDLDDLEHVPVQQLSAGWQQRVTLTRLITMPSALWLLDEPTSNLDNEGVSLLHSLMQTRLEQGGIILIASHQPMQGDKVKTINISDISIKSEVFELC